MTYWTKTPPAWQPTEDEYFASPAVGSSSLALFARNREAFHRGDKVEMTDAMLRGRVVDCAITEPDLLPERYFVDTPEKREAMRWGHGKWPNAQPVSENVWRAAMLSVKALVGNGFAMKLLRGPGLSQACHRWTHPSGIDCRFRIDHATATSDGRPVIVDLKNWDIDPDRIGAEIDNRGTHRQMALYSQGFQDLWGVVPGVILVIVPPSGAWIESQQLSAKYLEIGRLDVDADLEAMAKCQRTGDWANPRAKTLNEAHPPRWVVTRSNERHGEQT